MVAFLMAMMHYFILAFTNHELVVNMNSLVFAGLLEVTVELFTVGLVLQYREKHRYG